MPRITFMNSRNLKLVGYLYPVGNDSIIIMSHGFASHQHAGGRFERAAKALNELGFSALSFDFCGCGESDDERLTLNNHVDDLNSVIAFVKSEGYLNIAFYAHSLGGLISLKCFSPEIKTMFLIGPATGAMDFRGEKNYTPEQWRELKEKGYYSRKVNQGVRQEIVVDQQLNNDLATVAQKELFNTN